MHATRATWLIIAVILAWLGIACGGGDGGKGKDAGLGSFAGIGAGTFAPAAGSGGVGAGTGGIGGSAGTLAAGTGGASGSDGGTPAAGACALTASRLRITEVDVGANVVSNEDEAALKPLVISPLPSKGARVAFMGDDANVHVVTLDENDHSAFTPATFPAHDFQDLYADEGGGVLLLTRDAQGGGTLNCGDPTNLCGTPPSPAIPCHDMYLVRFGSNGESWATKLTNSSAALPPYSTGKTGPDVYMIWWYAHHGRIAFDGSHYASYFGSAISVTQQGCINIHQGDRMQLVDTKGALQAGGFEWGCSHSGYERILWDEVAQKFVTVCKTDNNNRIAFAPNYTTIRAVDLAYSNLGNLVRGSGAGTDAGYWLTASDLRAGQPAGMDGLAEVHLLHFTDGAPDKDLLLPSAATENARAPHLAAYGEDRLLAAWETAAATGDLAASDTMRVLHLQTRSRVTGEPEGDPIVASVRGNRYQDLIAFPDGSVAYLAPGSSATKLSVLRVLPCE